jgi:hypothetical protein
MASTDYAWLDVSSDDSGDWRIYYTRHSQTAALHYVYVDVSLDYSDNRMTCHIYTASLQYVYVDESLVYSDHWMTYCTRYRKIAAAHCVCIDVSSHDSHD